MKKVMVVYKSNSGNTKMMAQAVASGAMAIDTEVVLKTFDQASVEDIENADSVAFGCPACGNEEIDIEVVLPFLELVKDKMALKKTALFGSYGWGEGTYMEVWYKDMMSMNAFLVDKGLTILNTPDSGGFQACERLGVKLR
ncbi:flavodoxin [Acidaminobacter sp. JC074]|uniref:flavodoxin domain-containing protein n=1 Tax=Acidaminobacter sp. JC074 TaxID=2530199 RepID=UPI001F107081|nr:flavodoxin domain-containing protein [Acidaminobacter sp. JC074]MCH4891054.1 flavodoxin [Acidaminobacter sp. JC074]